MSYPSELIPKPNYRYITDLDLLADRHLLRWHKLKPKLFYDEVTDLPVSVEMIEKFTKNVRDLSTSLLGNFMPEHYTYQLTLPIKTRREYLIFDAWPEGETVVDPPLKGEWMKCSVGTHYHLPIQAIDGKEVRVEFGEEVFLAHLSVRHTPCRSNYWHFSIRVIDDKGIDVASRYANKPKKKLNSRDDHILKAARLIVLNQVRKGVPAFTPIPEVVYVSN